MLIWRHQTSKPSEMNLKIKFNKMLILIRASSVNISNSYQNQDQEMEVKNQILLRDLTRNHIKKKKLNKIINK